MSGGSSAVTAHIQGGCSDVEYSIQGGNIAGTQGAVEPDVVAAIAAGSLPVYGRARTSMVLAEAVHHRTYSCWYSSVSDPWLKLTIAV